MKDTSEIDFLIIGQGLAGSALAMRALAGSYNILVVDDPLQNHSSRRAAGLFNPITGRNFIKTWLADELFPNLFEFYPQVERLTAGKFFHPMPLHRPFASVEQQNEWTTRSADARFSGYIEAIGAPDVFGDAVYEPHGGVTLKQTGYLDTSAYLLAVRRYLQSKNAYRQDRVDLSALDVSAEGVRWKDIRARRAVFCQGVHHQENPWFKKVRVNSLKGEFLTVQCRWKKNVILNRGVYLVPGPGADEWRVGATYNWNDHSPGTTSWAKNELLQKLEAFFRFPYTVSGQSWGVRPTTPDRKPILGAHPEYPSLVIFNGLGTKGVSLAPYFSEVLIRWMENEGTIHEEADISRFY